jgi:peptide/nickel transport system substrate-binding protein
MSDIELDTATCVPERGAAGTLIGRCWVPGADAGPASQTMNRLRTVLITTLLLTVGAAQAVTLRVANAGDVTSMDPHSLNESLQLSFTGNVYDPLVTRGKDMSLQPSLATKWTQTSPTVWRFELRRGVTFHDGTPFDADDVVFTFKRAAGDGSDMKGYTAPIKQVRKVDDFTVDVETTAPFPILPDTFTALAMMSKKWCEANRTETPVDRRKGIENAASFKANGTGPYRLRERQPSTRTVLVRNLGWWGKNEGNVDEVIFTPIGNDATRVAALLSGEVDVIEPVPLQDVERVSAAGNLAVLQGPELRTIFLGMDQKRDELLFSNVKGKNPFKDKRVRQAFYQAIDIETIKSRVMRNAATPTALMLGPGVKGFQPDMNKRLPYDPEGAKKLLAEAGYPNGFEVTMNCPNDRYVNDSAICQAVAANLARVGVKINLQVETKVTYFPKILRRDTSLYLLGWTPGTVDAHDPLHNLMATPTEKGQGTFNLGSYSNPALDELAAKIQSETDPTRRNTMIREALKIHSDDIGHIPLHQQALAWGFAKKVSLVQLPNNVMFFRWVTVGAK